MLTTRQRNWSQLAFDFTLKFLDGSSDVEVRSSVADAIRWENNHGGKSFVEDTPSTSDLVWLAWCACRRLQITDTDFAGWAANLADFAADPVTWDKDAADAGLDPTQTAQSDA